MKIIPVQLSKEQQLEELQKLSKQAKKNLDRLLKLMQKASETTGDEKPYGSTV
ncbi:MAG: hypothetical protein US57_C0002G0055 [Candidatus Moranbacteria bacterium GW2011_GWC2_37_73]|nr:MAG: hypothetical protein UR95_C0002G0153 [Parcubacteria group bacterium GW2011_GWC1_36_108]KKQ01004.1 MAG: hypothetical protein US09_C0003G0004 [Candidatus Moranbacteria bacterium GW2011_GWD1_36_198]KKQ02406.1 MAG: hypothetical protein US10_C0001G0004 [Candidatus Moranbacteria bacterium GW2011_GWD2_36_198]KKQ40348.1 MAG: hypothetical protein US57_C0002G0055 [Candidatus Moranbacteria bacterium GW2011_GWC2_37_73]